MQQLQFNSCFQTTFAVGLNVKSECCMRIFLPFYFISTRIRYLNKFIKMCSIAAFGNPLLDIIVNIKNNELLIKYDVNPDDQKEISDKDMINLYKDVAK